MKLKAVFAACLLATGTGAMVPEQNPTVGETEVVFQEAVQEVSASELQRMYATYGKSKKIVLTVKDGGNIQLDADLPSTCKFIWEGKFSVTGDDQPHNADYFLCFPDRIICLDHVTFRVLTTNQPDGIISHFRESELFRDLSVYVENAYDDYSPLHFYGHPGSKLILVGGEYCVDESYDVDFTLVAKPGDYGNGPRFYTSTSLPLVGIDRFVIQRLTGSGPLYLEGRRSLLVTIREVDDFQGVIQLDYSAAVDLPLDCGVTVVSAAGKVVRGDRVTYYGDLQILVDDTLSPELAPEVEVVDAKRLPSGAVPVETADGRLVVAYPYGCQPLPDGPREYQLSQMRWGKTSPLLRPGDTINADAGLFQPLKLIGAGKISVHMNEQLPETVLRYLTVEGATLDYTDTRLHVNPEIDDELAAILSDPERWTGTVRVGRPAEMIGDQPIDFNRYGNESSSVCPYSVHLQIQADSPLEELRILPTITNQYVGMSISSGNVKRLAIRRIDSVGVVELKPTAACAMKIEDVTGLRQSLYVHCPVTMEGDYEEPGTTGLLKIPAGKTFTLPRGRSWRSSDILWVDGKLVLESGAYVYYERVMGQGCVETHNFQLSGFAVRGAEDGTDRLLYYPTMEVAAAAYSPGFTYRVMDPELTTAPPGFEIVVKNRLRYLQKKPFKGLMVIAR